MEVWNSETGLEKALQLSEWRDEIRRHWLGSVDLRRGCIARRSGGSACVIGNLVREGRRAGLYVALGLESEIGPVTTRIRSYGESDGFALAVEAMEGTVIRY